MLFFTIWKSLREPQVGWKSRRFRDCLIVLPGKKKFAIFWKRKGVFRVVQSGSRKPMKFPFPLHLLERWSISRPPGRERIETHSPVSPGRPKRSISRPPGRERIETDPGLINRNVRVVSPGLRVGSGLKRERRYLIVPLQGVSPGLRVGSGLKLEGNS